MNEKRTNLEVIAPTIEEAVSRGLADLGLPEEAVDIEVLDEGSRGLFGLGSRQARVRLSIKVGSPGTTAQPDQPTAMPEPEAVAAAGPDEMGPSTPEVKSQPLEGVASPEGEPEMEPGEDQEGEPEAGERALSVARQVVAELVDRMHIDAEVTASFGEPDEPHNRPPLLVDIEGDDLSILIGPRAETLNALQYISSLIIGKELGRSVPLVVDVEGYRQRRAREVRLLARQMAEQAVRTGKRQFLEPMPANERRLVHIELRDHPDVTTESVGEEPRRKVTILLKK
jgi:spoIIIJ-associated protein